MIKPLLILLLSLVVSCLAFALEPSGNLFVGSDFHLFPAGFDYTTIENESVRKIIQQQAQLNRQSFESMLTYLRNDPAISSVILNGDVFQAGILSRDADDKNLFVPVISSYDDEVRIEIVIKELLRAHDVTGKEVYFNLGNHDLKAEFTDGKAIIDLKFADLFATRFKEAIDGRARQTGVSPPIYLVGAGQSGYGNYLSVFDLEIHGRKIKLSHAPFVMTDGIAAQAELFKDSNRRAYNKVVLQPKIETNDTGVIYLFGDTHTPGADHKLNVFNSGALAIDGSLPYGVPTFMIFEGKLAKYYTLNPLVHGKIKEYSIPKLISYCRKFYR